MHYGIVDPDDMSSKVPVGLDCMNLRKTVLSWIVPLLVGRVAGARILVTRGVAGRKIDNPGSGSRCSAATCQIP